MPQPRLESIRIEGFRPFKDFTAELGALEVLVGANGSGKSSLFEFLRFLRDGMLDKIPPEIVAGSLGREVFHVPGPESFKWLVTTSTRARGLSYRGVVDGPVGRPSVTDECVVSNRARHPLMWVDGEGNTCYQNTKTGGSHASGYVESRLVLSTLTSPNVGVLYDLRVYLSSWRFYSSFVLADDKIRKPVLIEQAPTLREDAGNLSSVLHYLMTEHQEAFQELQQHLRTVVPGFKGLTVKARGGPGEVIAFMKEDGIDEGLPVADLSDGILRLICWITLCVHPNPPPLICIDEPDQGVHPRTLPVLAALFEKASQRTQILLATHSSYFLSQFDISRIAVIRKENGEAKFVKPKDSAVLMSMLEDFGSDEIEVLHRSDELERLP